MVVPAERIYIGGLFERNRTQILQQLNNDAKTVTLTSQQSSVWSEDGRNMGIAELGSSISLLESESLGGPIKSYSRTGPFRTGLVVEFDRDYVRSQLGLPVHPSTSELLPSSIGLDDPRDPSAKWKNRNITYDSSDYSTWLEVPYRRADHVAKVTASTMGVTGLIWLVLGLATEHGRRRGIAKKFQREVGLL